MQFLRSSAVYLIGLTGLFAPCAAQAQDAPAPAQAEDKGVILDLEALESLKRDETSQTPKETTYIVAYEAGAVEPSEAEKGDIAKVATAARGSMARLAIVAYAPMAEGQNENDARRLALRRAIALRQILVAAGVDGSRVNLQPMGIHPEGGEKSDQAEIIVRQP